MRYRFVSIGVSLLTLVASHAAWAASKAPADGAEPQGGGAEVRSTNDIVVTATKRTEKLQDVPAAITALGGEMLASIGAQSFKDYSSLVPGLSQRDYGNPGQGTIIIRGLNTGPTQLTNTTATYIDDVPFTASGFQSVSSFLTADPDIADVERVEVLKGPQGTLYGANSLGGMIRIVSRKPDLKDIHADASVEGSAIDGGGQGYAIHASGNLPIIEDKLALRINGVYRRAPGWTDNVLTGTNNVNSSIIKGFRAALRYRPMQRLTIDLSGIVQDIDNHGYALQYNKPDTLTPVYGRNKYGVGLDLGSQLKYRMGSLSVDYDAGPVSLIATGNYGQYRTQLHPDWTDTYGEFVRGINPAAAAAIPAGYTAAGDFSPNLDKWTGELRAVSKRLGPVEFMTGVFYTKEHSLYRSFITIYGPDGKPIASPFDALVHNITVSDYEEYAGYGNLTVYLNHTIDVTGGIRYAHNNQFLEVPAPGSSVFYAPRAPANYRSDDSVATYLGTLRWRPDRNVTFYARAASGYRPGGPQTSPTLPVGAPTAIKPDTVWNYESGVKATLLDGQFSIDASVFHIDWDNIQLSTIYGGFVLQANGGKAQVDGLELEMTARPTHNLTVSTNVGYTNSRLTRVDPGVSASIGAYAGDKLPLTPPWTVAMLADQKIPLSDTLTASLGGTVRMRSDMPSSFAGSTINPNVKIPSLTTLDLRAGLNFERYAVQFRVENVTNAFGYSSLVNNRVYAGQPSDTQATVIRPRMFTLGFSVRY